MKKILSALLITVSLLALVSCGEPVVEEIPYAKFVELDGYIGVVFSEPQETVDLQVAVKDQWGRTTYKDLGFCKALGYSVNIPSHSLSNLYTGTDLYGSNVSESGIELALVAEGTGEKKSFKIAMVGLDKDKVTVLEMDGEVGFEIINKNVLLGLSTASKTLDSAFGIYFPNQSSKLFLYDGEGVVCSKEFKPAVENLDDIKINASYDEESDCWEVALSSNIEDAHYYLSLVSVMGSGVSSYEIETEKPYLFSSSGMFEFEDLMSPLEIAGTSNAMIIVQKEGCISSMFSFNELTEIDFDNTVFEGTYYKDEIRSKHVFTVTKALDDETTVTIDDSFLHLTPVLDGGDTVLEGETPKKAKDAAKTILFKKSNAFTYSVLAQYKGSDTLEKYKKDHMTPIDDYYYFELKDLCSFDEFDYPVQEFMIKVSFDKTHYKTYTIKVSGSPEDLISEE